MQSLSKFLAALALAGFLAACGERQADVTRTTTHQTGTLVFEHPANWKITSEIVDPAMQMLILESPGSAIVILRGDPADETVDLLEFQQEFSSDATEEIAMGKITKSKTIGLPEADGYEWLQEDFTITLLGQSIPHRRMFGSKEIGDRRVFLILQAAVEDLAKVEPGFDLVRRSMRPGLAGE